MHDLIDRKAAIDILDAYQVMVENGEENPYSWARFRMSELPAAQPEIVRCKDCKYWREGTVYLYCDKLFGMGVLDAYDYMTDEDDYCSMAERKNDE